MDYRCPHCSEVMEISERFVGREGMCPTCKHRFVVELRGPPERRLPPPVLEENRFLEGPRCPACRAPVDPGFVACPRCGCRLGAFPASPPAARGPEFGRLPPPTPARRPRLSLAPARRLRSAAAAFPRPNRTHAVVFGLSLGFAILAVLALILIGKKGKGGGFFISSDEARIKETVNRWLEAQQKGESGYEYWHPDSGLLKSQLFAVRGWEILAAEIDRERREKGRVKARIDSSTKGGFAITAIWTISLKRDGSAWKISFISEQ